MSEEQRAVAMECFVSTLFGVMTNEQLTAARAEFVRVFGEQAHENPILNMIDGRIALREIQAQPDGPGEALTARSKRGRSPGATSPNRGGMRGERRRVRFGEMQPRVRGRRKRAKRIGIEPLVSDGGAAAAQTPARTTSAAISGNFTCPNSR